MLEFTQMNPKFNNSILFFFLNVKFKRSIYMFFFIMLIFEENLIKNLILCKFKNKKKKSF